MELILERQRYATEVIYSVLKAGMHDKAFLPAGSESSFYSWRDAIEAAPWVGSSLWRSCNGLVRSPLEAVTSYVEDQPAGLSGLFLNALPP